MGPEASAVFYRRLIELYQTVYGCANDYDFPEIILINVPLPEVVASFDKTAISCLQYYFNRLQDVDFIVSPCNTANSLFPYLKTKVPVLNIFDTVLKYYDSRKTGILGTKRTVDSGEFQKRFQVFEVPTKRQQKTVTKIITKILSGGKADKEEILQIIQYFKSKSCDSVVLGCTELPLLISQKDTDIKIYDTLEILAQATVEYSAGGYDV